MNFLRGLPLSLVGWIALLAALGSAGLAWVAMRLPEVAEEAPVVEIAEAGPCTLEERFTLPSGRAARLCELLVETQPFSEDDWLIVRVVVPDLQVTGVRDGHFDHDYLCDTIGRENAAPGTARIVIQLMAEAFPRGQASPGITQSIEAYSPGEDACIWELL